MHNLILQIQNWLLTKSLESTQNAVARTLSVFEKMIQQLNAANKTIDENVLTYDSQIQRLTDVKQNLSAHKEKNEKIIKKLKAITE